MLAGSEKMFDGSENVFAGSGDDVCRKWRWVGRKWRHGCRKWRCCRNGPKIVSILGNENTRRWRVIFGVFGKGDAGKMEVFGGSLWIWVGH